MNLVVSKRARRASSIALSLMLAATTAIAQSLEKPAAVSAAKAPAALPFKPGETLTYEISASKLIFSGIIGEIRLTVAPTTVEVKEGEPNEGVESKPKNDTIEIKAEAISKGFFPALLSVKVKDQFQSVIVASGFTVRNSTKLIQEGKVKREEHSVVDHDTKRITYTLQDLARPKAEPKSQELSCVLPVQDMLSALYFVRTQPLREGDVISVPIYDAGVIYDKVEAVVGKREEVKTSSGRVNAIRLNAKVFDGRFIKRAGELIIWLTDDDRRVPIRARAKASGMTVTAELKSSK